MKKKIKKFKKRSGSLIPFSFKRDMPFKVKRIFFINGKKNFIRGQHAHKRCSQYLFSLLGKIEVKIINKKGQKKNYSKSQKKLWIFNKTT